MGPLLIVASIIGDKRYIVVGKTGAEKFKVPYNFNADFPTFGSLKNGSPTLYRYTNNISITIKIIIHSSCEIEDFVETHICKLCVILRSRVLRVVCPY